MYLCTNCGTQLEELYRRYCPSVLKLLKCESCGQIADKYIEYDPVIILLDLLLIEKRAYRHLLYNSNVKSYWKLLIVLWLAESFRTFSDCNENINAESIFLNPKLQANCSLYVILLRTGLKMASFLLAVLGCTEAKYYFFKRPECYTKSNLVKALIIGAFGESLGFFTIVWKNVARLHYLLIEVYTLLCLLTAYSVVCNSGKLESLLLLGIGVFAYYFSSTSLDVSNHL